MEIINLTPHAVTLITDYSEIVIESSGIARASESRKFVEFVNGIPLHEISLGAVFGLPEEQDGIAYIVSRIVSEALPERNDLYIPDRVVRDGKGQVVGCLGLGIVKD